MATDPKKISIYMIAGIALAMIIILSVYTSGIQFPSMSENPGQPNASPSNPQPSASNLPSPTSSSDQNIGNLVVSIKDAPVDIQELWITLDGLEVQGKNGWIELDFLEEAENVNFDLLKLEDTSKYLSITQLPTGNYSKIRLHVKDASATFQDDTTAELKVPSQKIDIIIKFEIQEEQNTEVLIDMTADWIAISNSHNLKPVLKATVTYSDTTPDQNTQKTQIPTETPTEEPTEPPEPTETPEETEPGVTAEPTEPTETATPTLTFGES